MKINKEELKRLSCLPDEELWSTVTKVAAEHGFKLPSKTPSHEELSRLRETLGGAKLNLFGAARILKDYRKGGGV